MAEEQEEQSLQALAVVRARCPALRLLLPDELWPQFLDWHEHPDEDAWHRSICLLALQSGHLSRLTTPIHRFLLAGDVPRPDLRSQYRRDLRERWMFSGDPLVRHRRSRTFAGRIVELQCAAWLESEGWAIFGLEALRAGPDIEASSPDHRATAFEVKAIGRQDEAFTSVLASLRGQPVVRWTTPESAANYLLLRALECAHQLGRYCGHRIAMLAIDHTVWHEFEDQIDEDWINWDTPAFLDGDSEWREFLATTMQRQPNFEADLPGTLHQLDALWLLRRSEGFEYRLHRSISLGGARRCDSASSCPLVIAPPIAR